ncbi:MAG: hypothetical protein V4474_01890 [Patescibacteria group bacterium]
MTTKPRITPVDRLIIRNGAGSIKDQTAVDEACRSGVATGITVGAGTVPYTRGNLPAKSEGTFFIHQTALWAMNSLGLPNPGIDVWEERFPHMIDAAHGHGKLLGFNLSGSSPQEYGEGARRAARCRVDYVQLNLSCKNQWGTAGNKPVAAEHPDLVVAILQEVERQVHFGSSVEIEAKVAPNDDPQLVADLCEVFAASGIVKRVIVANARGGRRRVRDDGTDALAFTAGDDPTVIHIGAESGRALTHLTPKLVEMYYDRLPPSIGVIALGGIFDGNDAYESIKCGAAGFECTTAYFQYGQAILNAVVGTLPDEYIQAQAA